MSENIRIIINAGYMTVRTEGYPDAQVPSWDEAIDLIRATFHVQSTVVGVEQAGQRFAYNVTADSVTTAAPDGLPSVFVTSMPWSVTVSELASQPAAAGDRDGAFSLAVSALSSLSDNPAMVHGLFIDGSGRRMPITVSTDGIYDGHLELPSPYATAQEAETQVMPLIDDALVDRGEVVSEDGMFDTSESFWEDDGVDDNDIVRSRVQSRTTGKKATRNIVIAGVAVVAIMILGLVGIIRLGGDDPEPEAAKPTTGLTKQIAGFDGQTASVDWSRAIGNNSRVGATPDGKYVATISSDHVLVVSDEKNGTEVASMPLSGMPQVGPRGTTVKGVPAIVVQTRDELTVWRKDMDAYTIDLGDIDEEVVVSYAGTEPLVATKAGGRTWRLGDGKLESWAKVPDGFRPYAIADDGTVIAGALNPSRVERFDKKGKSKGRAEFEGPKDLTEIQRWISVRKDFAILAWNDNSGLIVTVNDVTTGKVLAKASYSDAALVVNSSAVSGDRSPIVGFPGGLVVKDGDSYDITETTGFVPTSVAGDLVYGRDKSGARALADPKTGKVTALKSTMAVPWSITASEKVIVVDNSVAFAVTMSPSSKETAGK